MDIVISMHNDNLGTRAMHTHSCDIRNYCRLRSPLGTYEDLLNDKNNKTTDNGTFRDFSICKALEVVKYCLPTFYLNIIGNT